MYTIEYAEGVVEHLRSVRAFERRRILDTIDEQLSHAPTQQTRNKKILVGLKVPWEHDEPMWELRIGDYRVFYDVNETAERVIVRAVRRKRTHQTTEEIL